MKGLKFVRVLLAVISFGVVAETVFGSTAGAAGILGPVKPGGA